MRFANDQTPYLRYGIEYRYNGLSWLETVKLFLAKQKIEQRSALQEFDINNRNKLDSTMSFVYLQRQNIARGEFSTSPLYWGPSRHRLSAKFRFRDKF